MIARALPGSQLAAAVRAANLAESQLGPALIMLDHAVLTIRDQIRHQPRLARETLAILAHAYADMLREIAQADDAHKPCSSACTEA